MNFDEIIDVRSPDEFAEDHLPNSINLPVLSNSERAEVGAIYKQVGSFEARRFGAALVSNNIAKHLKEHLCSKDKEYMPLIYCWRGGERSRSMAVVLNSIGWKPHLLEGGYNSYRRYVCESLDNLLNMNPTFQVIAGLTGSGKTLLLNRLADSGQQVLDLEGLAAHRGSALGEEISRDQPSQKMFERLIFEKFQGFDLTGTIFLESESSRIGNLQIPAQLWAIMKKSSVVEIEVPRESRAEFLLHEYVHLTEDLNTLKEKLEMVRPFHSDETFQEWISMIEQSQFSRFVDSLLEKHYDPAYLRSRVKTYQKPEHHFKLPKISTAAMDELAAKITGSLNLQSDTV